MKTEIDKLPSFLELLKKTAEAYRVFIHDTPGMGNCGVFTAMHVKDGRPGAFRDSESSEECLSLIRMGRRERPEMWESIVSG